MCLPLVRLIAPPIAPGSSYYNVFHLVRPIAPPIARGCYHYSVFHLVAPTIMFSRGGSYFNVFYLDHPILVFIMFHLDPPIIVFCFHLVGLAPPIAPISPGSTGIYCWLHLIFTWLDFLWYCSPGWTLYGVVHLVGSSMVLFTWFDWQVPVVRSSHLSQVKAAVQKRLAASNLSERLGTKSQEKPKKIL